MRSDGRIHQIHIFKYYEWPSAPRSTTPSLTANVDPRREKERSVVELVIESVQSCVDLLDDAGEPELLQVVRSSVVN